MNDRLELVVGMVIIVVLASFTAPRMSSEIPRAVQGLAVSAPASVPPSVQPSLDAGPVLASEAFARAEPPMPAAPPRYADASAFAEALARSPWPPQTWSRVTAIAWCESGVDTDGDGTLDAFDLWAVGQYGEQGLLQIRPSVHPELVIGFDLFSLRENLQAGYVVFWKARQTFEPWGCA